MADYEYTTDLDVRFRDLDAMGHVNNAVYATYLEQARADYYADVVGVPLPEADTVLVNLSIAYQRPITADETVTVALGVGDLGESSVPMEYEIRTGDGVAATAETVQVVFDRETGESRSIPKEWRDRIARYAQSDG
ncbi:thioesterase family protein [Halorussus sp. MSC15.2]|uniref:acyl-CoA thioesterase n=1 Tax=Halorussus sp. MSC15.2 TaxID=2283638 RepID=UPI0013D55FF7|nr:thioesterase family protein [Halorussus sp. MSC15.2]NEU58655.1 acyl-CoA thioesterase [Halorussus sp. MSC15.2]